MSKIIDTEQLGAVLVSVKDYVDNGFENHADKISELEGNQTTLANIEEAMQNLPDGQFVSAQVAINTAQIKKIENDILSESEKVNLSLDKVDKLLNVDVKTENAIIEYDNKYVGSRSNGLVNSNYYMVAKPVSLKRGECIVVYTRSTSSVGVISISNTDGSRSSVVIGYSTGTAERYEYTADSDCDVVLCMHKASNPTYEYHILETSMRSLNEKKLSDAPNDGKQYARKNGEWSAIEEQDNIDSDSVTYTVRKQHTPGSVGERIAVLTSALGDFSRLLDELNSRIEAINTRLDNIDSVLDRLDGWDDN